MNPTAQDLIRQARDAHDAQRTGTALRLILEALEALAVADSEPKKRAGIVGRMLGKEDK